MTMTSLVSTTTIATTTAATINNSAAIVPPSTNLIPILKWSNNNDTFANVTRSTLENNSNQWNNTSKPFISDLFSTTSTKQLLQLKENLAVDILLENITKKLMINDDDIGGDGEETNLSVTIKPSGNETDLESIIGPARDSYSIVILMTIVYVAILITGVSGNLITCLVIARKRYMHTATNYYLFSLAVSDLLLLILGLPHDLVLLWRKYPYVFGEAFCIIRGFSSELSTNASILTIIAFTIERYIAICHPLRSHTTLKLGRVVKTIVIIWIISALSALPISYQFGIVYVMDEEQRPYDGSDHCAVRSLLYSYIFEIATMVFFVIPICIITVLYILIGIKLRASSKSVHNVTSGHVSNHHHHQHNHSSKDDHSPTAHHSHQFKTRLKLMKGASCKSSSSTSGTNLYHHNAKDESNVHHLSMSVRRQNASRRAVIKMLVAVVIAFFFCYSPFHAQRVMAIVMARNNVSDENFIQIFTLLTHVSGITYYLSSTINPILYQVMSKKFQLALRETLPCCKKSRPDPIDLDLAFSTATVTPNQQQQQQQQHNNNNNIQSIKTIVNSTMVR